MKKHHYLLAILLFSCSLSYSQLISDNMESYTEGSEIFQDHWTSWTGVSAEAIFSSSAQARSGSLSGWVPDNGTTDGVLDLGNKIFGEWYLTFYMYVPSNKEAYWNIQGEVPIGSGQWVVGNIFFNQDIANPGVGLIDNSALGTVNFNFPHDEWFEVEIAWDINSGISAATWSMNINDTEVIPVGTAFTSSDGTTATSLGGINFFSISTNNELYVDDFSYDSNPPLSVTDNFISKDFNIIMDPSNQELQFQAKEVITDLAIYNMVGQKIDQMRVNANSGSMETTHLPKGAYLIQVTIGDTKGTVKFAK